MTAGGRSAPGRSWRDICLLGLAALLVLGWLALLVWASPRLGRAAMSLLS